jgi:predicted nucleic acid-binding protein
MTKFVVDAGTVLRLAEAGDVVPDGHELLAPTLVRSQMLATMHEAVARGDLSAADALGRLDRAGAMRIRLLGDAVLRRTAWKVADRLGWASTFDAEYVALAILQGDYLVTADDDLARAAAGEVRVAPYSALVDLGS